MKIKKPDLRHGSTPLWIGGVIAALLLTLGVNGTLSSWTQAIITNSNNSVATGTAVILQETSGANTCISSSNANNQSTCSTINKYGGTTTPLIPGGTQQVDATFTNVGSVAGSSFVLAAAACVQTPAAGAGTPPAANVCTNGDLTVQVRCTDGATFTGTPYADLTFGPAAPGTFTGPYTHTATIAINGSITCRFIVALSATATPTDQGITVTQQMTWTLNK